MILAFSIFDQIFQDLQYITNYDDCISGFVLLKTIGEFNIQKVISLINMVYYQATMLKKVC